jgi:hypothetical protein
MTNEPSFRVDLENGRQDIQERRKAFRALKTRKKNRPPWVAVFGSAGPQRAIRPGLLGGFDA